MPNIYRYSADLILKEIEACVKLGINSFCLFPSINDKLKNKTASEALNKNGLYLKTISLIKKYYPNSSFVTIADAGHWVHADQPIRLVEIIKSYCI